MERLSLPMLMLLCLCSLSGRGQEPETLFFEQSDFVSDNALTHPKVKTLLFSPRIFRTTDLLLQAVSIPAFEPPWAIHLYNPFISRIDSSTGLQVYGYDTTKYILELRKAATALTIERKDYKALAKKTITRSKIMPNAYAWEAIEAFIAALALTRWPQEFDLASLDGTEYHFAVGNVHRFGSTSKWAQVHDYAHGTHTEKLVNLAGALARYADAAGDSLAASLLQDVHCLARELTRER